MFEWTRADFARDHPEVPSPVLRHLPDQEAAGLRANLQNLIGEAAKNGRKLVHPILFTALTDNPDFSLKATIEREIGRHLTRLIAFERAYWLPGEALEYEATALDHWFQDLWVPGLHDIDITDPEGSFLFRIHHEDALQRLDV